jgi:hypothetical protein
MNARHLIPIALLTAACNGRTASLDRVWGVVRDGLDVPYVVGVVVRQGRVP